MRLSAPHSERNAPDAAYVMSRKTQQRTADGKAAAPAVGNFYVRTLATHPVRLSRPIP